MLTDEQLNQLEQQLQTSKSELEKRLKEDGHFDLLRSHAHDSTGELSSYDNHPGDEGTELYEREKDIALNVHERTQLDETETALHAIEEGEYGICAECRAEIPFERLQAIPTTLYCIEHTPSRDTSHDRPIEEGVLMPPFGKFDLDEQDESVVYDAEDSWQEVASYGTSESPSDFVYPPSDYEDMYVESEENIGYVEDYENFVGVDIEGKNITIYPNSQQEKYEDDLDEEDMMSILGDLPRYEHDPYVEDDKT
jgi:YteA family regulatory protein